MQAELFFAECASTATEKIKPPTWTQKTEATHTNRGGHKAARRYGDKQVGRSWDPRQSLRNKFVQDDHASDSLLQPQLIQTVRPSGDNGIFSHPKSE